MASQSHIIEMMKLSIRDTRIVMKRHSIVVMVAIATRRNGYNYKKLKEV